jgi:hypothetical protein
VGGKTGTAQVVRLEHTEHLKEHEVPIRYRDHAWFVSFAPVESPEIAVAVLSEHGGHGGSAAAPIAQKILARYFAKKLGTSAPEPAGQPQPAEAVASASAGDEAAAAAESVAAAEAGGENAGD